MAELQMIDWVIVAAYFAAVFGVALWVARPKKHIRDSSAGYFLAGRNAGWFVIGASLFASNVGSEHLVGLAGTGFKSGIAMGQFELQASLVLLLLGWFFTPFYLSSGVFTMPEFLERRYSAATRWYLALVCIFAYVLTKISVTLYAGGIVFQSLFGGNFWTGVILIVIATGVYTILGGLRAVLYTDMLQTFVLLIGAGALLFLGLNKLGGWGEMVTIATAEDSGFMSVWKSMKDPEFPWTGFVFGAPIVAIWYWCTDQFIVQRVLSAKNIDHARMGTIWGGFIKQSALFLFVIPGVIAYCLIQRPDLVSTTTGQPFALSEGNMAFPELVKWLLPAGLKGLVFAGLLAALMSSLSSVFNSCSTLVTWDVYKKMYPQASERRLVIVGQIATIAMVAIGLAWVPFMKHISNQLYIYLQSVQAYISPPIAAVFLLGILWKRVNSTGAMTSMLAGFVLGMGRLALEVKKNLIVDAVNIKGLTPEAAAASQLQAVHDYFGTGFWYHAVTMNFMHVCVFLTIISVVILVGVSLLTKPPAPEKVANLTLQTVDFSNIKSNPAWRKLQIALTILLIAIVCAVWLYFRPE